MAIKVRARQHLAAIPLRKTLESGGLSKFSTGDVERREKKKDNLLAVMPETSDQLNEASRLLDMAKLEKGIEYRKLCQVPNHNSCNNTLTSPNLSPL